MRRALCVLLMSCAVVTASAVPAIADDAAPTAPKITLLTAGKAPRTEIRYALVQGASQQVTLGVNTSISQKVGDRPTVQGSTPQIDIDLSAAVAVVTADGAANLTFSFDAVHVGSGASASAIRTALEPIVGVTGALSLTSRGEVTSSDVAIPPEVEKSAAQLIEQLVAQSRTLTVPFPIEAVGVGARWEARTAAQISGIRINQTARYELLRRRGDTVDLAVRITQRAPHQTYTDPASGTTVELRSSKGHGDGKTKVALNQPLPRKGDLHVGVDQSLRIKGTSVSQSLTINAFVDPG
jgi:hypothetical protein